MLLLNYKQNPPAVHKPRMMIHRYDNDTSYNDYMKQTHIRSQGPVTLRCGRQTQDVSLGREKQSSQVYMRS